MTGLSLLIKIQSNNRCDHVRRTPLLSRATILTTKWNCRMSNIWKHLCAYFTFCLFNLTPISSVVLERKWNRIHVLSKLKAHRLVWNGRNGQQDVGSLTMQTRVNAFCIQSAIPNTLNVSEKCKKWNHCHLHVGACLEISLLHSFRFTLAFLSALLSVTGG